MIIKNIILVLAVSSFFLSMTAISFAGEKQYPIDKALGQCMSKDYSTAGMNNCTYAAEIKWDAEINKYYLLLMKKLSKEEVLKLKESQRAWIKFRDKEFKFIYSRYFEHMEGTIYTNIAATSKNEIVKGRALDLKTYYDILQNQKH